MQHNRPLVFIPGLLLVLLGTGQAGEQPSAPAAEQAKPTAEQIKFFETNVRPVLANYCYKCHGPEKQKGDLRLDSFDALRKGGTTGPAFVAGRPEESLLLTAIAYKDDSLKMPPSEKLADRHIAALTQWIKMGAPYPAGQAATVAGSALDLEAGRNFWSFKPPVEPPLPTVRNTGWPQSPIDHFVLAKLEESGLNPVPAADKRSLIRRATFDLTGLPPAPAEIEAFLADNSPDAFSRVVDRLLASPHYGERWGRHWLDVARYADSNGLDENVVYGNAWRYRDYVVAAFNRDKPYDQFVLEQIAGDLLPPAEDLPTRHERLIATGFLALGPKVLAEVDEQKMEMDIIDEQIDTVGRAFLGLTLGCARCHDHKFDPINTEDYYALAGIFKSTRTMEHFKKIAKWHENPLLTEQLTATQAAFDQQVAGAKAAVQKFIDEANERLKAAATPPGKLPDKPEEAYSKETKAELARMRAELAKLTAAAPDLPSAMGAAEGQVTDVAVHIRGSHLTLGKVVPRRFPEVFAGRTPTTFDPRHSGRLEFAQWLVGREHPLTSRVMVNRIWREHFGQGLVRSTDNFGKLGELPTNPPLLDWLAMHFMNSGWSMKALHRLIMLSSVYQMSSTYDARAAEVDPENSLLWRMDARRLEAEEIRDALLAVSGGLDVTMGGTILPLKNRAYVFDHTSKDATRYDSHRRALYLPVIRNNVYDVFQLFDFADPGVLNGNRATTTVAPQALFMMNSDLVTEASEKLASLLWETQSADDASRFNLLYLTAYGRPATDRELARARSYLAAFDRDLDGKEADPLKRRQQAWSWLCQTVMAANEFVYVK